MIKNSQNSFVLCNYYFVFSMQFLFVCHARDFTFSKKFICIKLTFQYLIVSTCRDAYNKLHRLTKTTSELNNSAIFTYDSVDNVIGIKDPKGTNTVFDYNSIGKVVQERSVDNTIRAYSYDRAGELIDEYSQVL